MPVLATPGTFRIPPFLGPGFLLRQALGWAWRLGRVLGWASRQLEEALPPEPPLVRALRFSLPLVGPTGAFFVGAAYTDLGELKADWLPWVKQQSQEAKDAEAAEKLGREAAEVAGVLLTGDPVAIAKESLDFGRELLATDPNAFLRGLEGVLGSIRQDIVTDPRVGIARGWLAAVGTVMDVVSGRTTDVAGTFWGWFQKTSEIPTLGEGTDPKPPKRLQERVARARKRISNENAAILRALKGG